MNKYMFLQAALLKYGTLSAFDEKRTNIWCWQHHLVARLLLKRGAVCAVTVLL